MRKLDYIKRRELGLCTYSTGCNNPLREGTLQCDYHHKVNNKTFQRWRKKYPDRYTANKKVCRINRRAKMREENKCLRCETPLDPDADYGRVTCMNCRDNDFQRRKKYENH